MEIENIEKFFLNILLRISILGVFLILISDIVLYPEGTLSIMLAATILPGCIVSYLIREKYPTIAVLFMVTIVLAAMTYQRMVAPNTATPLAVILALGFIISTMLKGKVMLTMHCIAFLILNTVFVFHVESRIVAAITFSTLYFILAYATWMLKSNYDKMTMHLRIANDGLQEKSNEIAAQNEELLQIQENLNNVNISLEKTVTERTAKIQLQNEMLIRYSYTNAHHLRGPVARLLGLASICKLEASPDYNFFMDKMVDQAKEMDVVIKQINSELELSQVENTLNRTIVSKDNNLGGIN